MPRPKQAPVVLTLQQKVQSWRHRGRNLRMIAATSHNASARKVLIQRAEFWEEQAVAAERDGALASGAPS